MRVVIDAGFKRDLSEKEMYALDSRLRKAMPELVGWSYSPLAGELVLDFGDADESSIISRVSTYLAKAGGKSVLRVELMDVVREWQG